MSAVSGHGPHSLSIPELALGGTTSASCNAGVGGALASGVLGAFGAQMGDRFGDLGFSVGGALGTAIGGVLLPRILTMSFKPWWSVVLWFVGGLLFALLVERCEPRHFDCSMVRWALPGSALGIVLGTYYEPIRLARGGEVWGTGKAGFLFVFDVAVILGALVKLVNARRFGSTLAGVIGGGLGSLWVASIMVSIGGRDVAEWLGSYLALPLCGVSLGMLGGGLGGWCAWSIAAGTAQPTMTTATEQPAGEDQQV